MSYTTPRTWVVSEIHTAAQLNEQLRDNLLAIEPISWNVVLDGGGAALTTDTFIDVRVPIKCDIVSIGAYGGDTDVTYSIEVDVLKIQASDFATAPDSDDSICASALITIATDAAFVEDATLTGWTKAVAAGSLLRYYVTACTSLTKVTIVTNVERS